ncbi:MAG: hypothetical protein JW384_02006 [Nitrosomonadaceae bacterium]|nr:hypothetical protein [Nitrosomonadaceae bacterium]
MIIALVFVAIVIYTIIGMILMGVTPNRLLYGSWTFSILVSLAWPYFLVNSWRI